MAMRVTVLDRDNEGRKPRVLVRDGSKFVKYHPCETLDEAKAFADHINSGGIAQSTVRAGWLSIDKIMEQHRDHILANTAKGTQNHAIAKIAALIDAFGSKDSFASIGKSTS